MAIVRRAVNTQRPEEMVERVLEEFTRSRNNREFAARVKKTRLQ